MRLRCWNSQMLWAAPLVSLFLLASVAHAYSLGDVVQAVERGLPEAVIEQMVAQGRDEWNIDDETAARLLRSGISESLLRNMSNGTQPTATALQKAKEPGPGVQSSDVAGRQFVAQVEKDLKEDSVSNPLQGPMFIDGHSYWVHTTADATINVMVREHDQFTAVMISYTNTSSERMDLFPASVELFKGAGTTSYQLQRVPPSSFVDRLESRNMLSGALRGMAVAGTIYGVSGGAGDMGDATRAHRYTTGVVQQSVAEGQDRIEYSESLLLRANTVHPGRTVAGMVPFKHRTFPGERFTVRVKVDDAEVVVPGRTRE